MKRLAWSSLNPYKRQGGLNILVAAFLACATTFGAASGQQTAIPPFTEGNFFVGRQPYPMYVEYRLPAKPSHETPIVLFHGAVSTGAGYVTTPDGREGWAIYFVRHGWKTYVVDWPGHGRSPMPEDFATMSLMRVVDDGVALLDQLGRAVVLTHSMSGPVGWKIAETAPDRTAAVIGIAPGLLANMLQSGKVSSWHGGKASDQYSTSGSSGPYLPEDNPVRYKRDAAKRILTVASLFPEDAFDAFYSSLVPESARALNELNDKDGAGIRVDPQRFAKVPMLVLVGDQDPRHTRDSDGPLAKFLGADFIDLADVGLPGHGHMMMLDKDNQKVAQVIIDWLVKKGL